MKHLHFLQPSTLYFYVQTTVSLTLLMECLYT